MSTATAATARILLIDANVFFARRVTEALKQEGFEVMTAATVAFSPIPSEAIGRTSRRSA